MRRVWVLVVSLFLGFSGFVQAQEATETPVSAAPVVMLVNGSELWSATDVGLQPLTPYGYVGRPVIDPMGGQVAYATIALIGIEALQVTGGLVSELPSDIEILDLATGTIVRVATQPEGATFNQGEPARAVVRSAPAWSPNGTQLAWTEDVQPENERRLVIYDLASATSQIIRADLPLQAGFQQTLPVRWGQTGIAVKSTTAAAGSDPAQPTMIEQIQVFGLDGSLLADLTPVHAQGEFVYEFTWMQSILGERLALLYSTGRWEWLDPDSGTLVPLPGEAELYSLTAPDQPGVIFRAASVPEGQTLFTWYQNGLPLPFTGPAEWLTISPDGRALAYAAGGTAYRWVNGEALEIFGTNARDASVSELVWGPVGWRVN